MKESLHRVNTRTYGGWTGVQKSVEQCKVTSVPSDEEIETYGS